MFRSGGIQRRRQLIFADDNNYCALFACLFIQEQYSVLVCLAAILHLGNIDIVETDHGFADIDSSSPSLLIAAVSHTHYHPASPMHTYW